jgi:hypothetical protein
MKKTIILTAKLFSISNISIAKDLYRAPSAGDIGTYYILESKELSDGVFFKC